ncbi:MAG TPA: hypothetical protein VM409_04690, partial [Chloroflexia bacterium]|nr:hypothetical protein [Chloroflexia bacterium]
ADALWALSRYVADAGEKPLRTLPTILLNDRRVQAQDQGNEPEAFSVALSSDALHPGTNWLKISVPGNRSVYYSLTLRARR